MKAVVMAAGKGVRMLPLTEKTPKALVEVNGKPFLYYVLTNLKKAGFGKIGIIVGYKKEQFKPFLKKYGFKAELIEQKEQRGTGHALMQAEKFIGEDNFVALGGDNLWGAGDLKAMQQDDLFCYVGGAVVKNPEKYGVLVVKGENLAEIKEKPKEDFGNLINTGLYKFSYEIFEALKRIDVSERGEYELTEAITLLAKQGKAKAVRIKGYWLDLGCREDIPKAEKFLKGKW